MFRLVASIGAIAAIAAFAQPAQAVILDWDAVTWTPCSLANSYNVDPANPANDVTVTAATGGGTVLMTDPVTGATSPTRNNTLTGGLTPAQNSLKISADLSSSTAYITITIDFALFYPLGVQNLSFSLFDIDLNGSSYRGRTKSARSSAATAPRASPQRSAASAAPSRTAAPG